MARANERNQNDLQRFYDGELGIYRAQRVANRIKDNPDDQKRLKALDQMGQMVRIAAEENADAADFSQLWAKVNQGIEAKTPTRVKNRFLRWGLPIAGLAAAALFAFFLLGPFSQAHRQLNSCVIESLEVAAGATSTIFTITDTELADATTVIWVSEAQGE